MRKRQKAGRHGNLLAALWHCATTSPCTLRITRLILPQPRLCALEYHRHPRTGREYSLATLTARTASGFYSAIVNTDIQADPEGSARALPCGMDRWCESASAANANESTTDDGRHERRSSFPIAS